MNLHMIYKKLIKPLYFFNIIKLMHETILICLDVVPVQMFETFA